jgi:SAM-dependent methyltransferase
MTVVSERLNLPESEPLGVGEVRLVSSEIVQDYKNHEYTVRHVEVGDESDLQFERRLQFNMLGDSLEQTLRMNPAWKKTIVEEKIVGVDADGDDVSEKYVTVADDNIAARWLYFDEAGAPTQLLDWASKFPTAIALEPLQRLEAGGKWLSNGEGPDARSLDLFTFMPDAIGLRSRARIYARSLVEYADHLGEDKLDIISLGSGASVPNIQATIALEAKGKAVNWKFYDFDPNALEFAEELVKEQDFQLSTFDFGSKRFDAKAKRDRYTGQIYQRAYEQEDESVDIVDALGLWEYLKPKLATDFARNLFRKVKPGGSMIVSNMLPSRPHREFNERAVGWPGLYLRNETDLLDIVEAAGIDTQQVTMTHAEDGVYVVMEIKKL